MTDKTADKAFDRRAIPAAATLSTWTAPDGWALRRMDWPQPPGASPRGSLLFLGGRGDFIEKYIEADAHWFDAGWNVSTFDWRGQGGSPGAAGDGHYDSFDPVVGDLAAVIAEWREASPGPHVVVGHSMGGHILMRVLADGRTQIDAAVLVAPMLGINSAPLPPFAASSAASTMTAVGMGRQPAWHQPDTSPVGSLRQRLLTACEERYADELWWWEREPEYNLGAPSWGWLKAAYESCAAMTPAKLAAIEPPVLLLSAEGDRLVSPAAIRAAAGHLPHAELVSFPDAAHEILREADPVRSQAFAAIDAFLEAHAPR